jgi:hypothetical protein
MKKITNKILIVFLAIILAASIIMTIFVVNKINEQAGVTINIENEQLCPEN